MDFQIIAKWTKLFESINENLIELVKVSKETRAILGRYSTDYETALEQERLDELVER